MKTKLSFYLISFMFFFLNTSCVEKDSHYELYREFKPIFLFEEYGDIKYLFYNVDSDNSYKMKVLKGGINPNSTGTVDLVIMSQDELNEYNMLNKCDCKLLPQEYFEIDNTRLEFVDNEKSKDVNIKIKRNYVENIEKLQDNYVIPIYLKSKDTQISEGKDYVLISPEFYKPSLTVSILNYEDRYEINTNDNEALKLSLVASVDIVNETNINVSLENDDEILDGFVSEYNSTNNVDYKLLPKEYYSLPEICFESGVSVKNGIIEINPDNDLGSGSYILPIVISHIDGVSSLNYSKSPIYIVMDITSEVKLNKIIVTEDMVSTNDPYTGGGNYSPWSAFDDKTWNLFMSAKGTSLNRDNIYGVYLDVDLSKGKDQTILNSIKFELTSDKEINKRSFGVGSKMDIYVGTSDSDLKKVAEQLDIFYDPSKTPKFTSDVINVNNKVTYIRFSFVESTNNDRSELWDLKKQVQENQDVCVRVYKIDIWAN